MTSPTLDQRGTPLPPGTEAPEFELSSSPDQTVSLSAFRGRPVVLVFYPEDWSPVCSDQLALYQELMAEFQQFDAQLVGISVDGIALGTDPLDGRRRLARYRGHSPRTTAAI